MSNVFVTSDEHIGHARIIELANRPFSSLEEMKETIIERHNKTVPDKKSFLTIHVGDWLWHTLTYEEGVEYISRMNGRHAFTFGNHDELIDKRRASFATMLEFIKGENKVGGGHILHHNKHKLTLNHYAQRVWDGSHKGHWHVYGHSHNGLPGLGKSFDIGVDGHDFTPWSLEEIEARMSRLSQHHTIDNTGAGSCDTIQEGGEIYRGKPSNATPQPCGTCGFAASCLDCLRLE
jgi:calcineurin-like phosphoesterase family protein